MHNLRLYPRGYFGAKLTGRIERITQPQSTSVAAVQNTFKVFQTPSSERVAPNDLVETLYWKALNGNPESLKFEFREKLYIAALSAFGTKAFDVWVAAQSSSPFFGTTHSDFLDDTLTFIATGKRKYSLNVWEALVKDDDDGEITKGLSPVAKEFFGISSDGSRIDVRNTDIVDVIHLWISHPGGIADLLGTLHVLFGDI